MKRMSRGSVLRLPASALILALAAGAPGVTQADGAANARIPATDLAAGPAGASDPAQAGAGIWLGPDGQALPFGTDAEVLEFLRSARVIWSKELSSGITRPKKMLLEKGGVQAHAVFHTVVRQEQRRKRLPNGRMVHQLRDSFRSQIAAYELARLLGLWSVPPTVEREIEGAKGSLQLWIENAMTEAKRHSRGLEFPDPRRRADQTADRWVFDNLINNIDRHQGNILIDRDWNIWLIDHTRSFGLDRDLPYPELLRKVNRGLWEHLKALDETAVRQRLKPYLGGLEIRALMARRQKLIALVEERIARLGEEEVLFAPTVMAATTSIL